ncbi:unnamed protein product [Rotaria socialis]
MLSLDSQYDSNIEEDVHLNEYDEEPTEVLACFSNVAGQLPQSETLLRTIRRQLQGPPMNSNNQLPDHLKQTDRGENFVLHEDEKLIIFTTATNLSVYPEYFYQMFTLHGLFKSQIIPLVYGLLVGKKTTDYDHFFQRIMDGDDFNPETILSDFEAATIKIGQFIVSKHSSQSIWRQIQSLGLQKKYQEDESFHLNIKKIIALAFVPVLDVIKAFNLIADDFEDEADDFLGYFEKTWIGEPKKRGTGQKKTLFPIDRAVANLPRSNNSIEGWHNAFAKRVTIVHPTITKLTEKIRREQSKFEVDIAQIRQGQEPKPKKLKYRKFDERIKRLVDDYGNVDLGEYLKGLAVNISL